MRPFAVPRLALGMKPLRGDVTVARRRAWGVAAAQVEIVPCDDGLCGRVAWLRSPFDEHGCELRDVANPDPVQRARGVLGIDLLRNVRASSERQGEWSGEIYDPTSGRTYAAELQMEGSDRLRVRGYLGIRLLGRTASWLRVGTENQCRADV